MIGVGGAEFLIGPLPTLAIPLILLFFIIKRAVTSGMKNALVSRNPESERHRRIVALASGLGCMVQTFTFRSWEDETLRSFEWAGVKG